MSGIYISIIHVICIQVDMVLQIYKKLVGHMLHEKNHGNATRGSIFLPIIFTDCMVDFNFT